MPGPEPPPELVAAARAHLPATSHVAEGGWQATQALTGAELRVEQRVRSRPIPGLGGIVGDLRQCGRALARPDRQAVPVESDPTARHYLKPGRALLSVGVDRSPAHVRQRLAPDGDLAPLGRVLDGFHHLGEAADMD